MLAYLSLFFLFFSSIGVAAERYPFENSAKREQFYYLTKQFRCLVCQNQDLASSNAALADDLRSKIYSQVREGKSNQSIKDYMQARYGEFILFSPLWHWQTMLLWLGPFLLLAIGLFLVFCVIKRAKPSKPC